MVLRRETRMNVSVDITIGSVLYSKSLISYGKKDAYLIYTLLWWMCLRRNRVLAWEML